jgi:hypothetical protein
MTDFLKLRTNGDLLLIRGTDLLIIREDVVAPEPNIGGGGRPRNLDRLSRPKQFLSDVFPVTGKLLFKDNLNLIAKLLSNQEFISIGFIRTQQITEAVGKLGFTESVKLNAKLKILEEKMVYQKKDLSLIKLLMDLLDDI